MEEEQEGGREERRRRMGERRREERFARRVLEEQDDVIREQNNVMQEQHDVTLDGEEEEEGRNDIINSEYLGSMLRSLSALIRSRRLRALEMRRETHNQNTYHHLEHRDGSINFSNASSSSSSPPSPSPPSPPSSSLALDGSQRINNPSSSSSSSSPAAPSTPDESGEGHVAFELCECDGGQFSPVYAPSNILRDDGTVYCSSRPSNITLILRYAPPPAHVGLSPIITHVVLKAPASGFTSPVREALILVGHVYPDPAASSAFDSVPLELFQKRINNQSTASASASALSPAAYVKLPASSNVVCVPLVPPRSARYVVVKLLSSGGCQENIDVQYLGFRGFLGKRAFPKGDLL